MVTWRIAGPMAFGLAVACYSCGKTKFGGQAPQAAQPPAAAPQAPVAPAPAPAAPNASTPASPTSTTPATPSTPATPTTPASPTTPTPSPTPTIGTTAPTCTPGSGTTVATLLTPFIQNGEPLNFVEYQLSLVDCAGNKQDFTAATISFDLNGEVTAAEAGTAMTYYVTDSANTMTGTLLSIQGSDLFGHTGSNYFHYSTSQSVDFATTDTSIIFHIDLTGREMSPFPSTAITSPNQIQTFLQFGTAAATSVVVGLTPMPGTANQYGTLP